MESASLRPLEERCVLVTGAARRIGAALARALHAEGARLLIHYRRSAQAAAALVEELNAARPHTALAIAADLTDCTALGPLIEAALASFGRLDVLINNASTFYPTPVGRVTPAQWEDLVATNLRAPFFLAQAAAPELKARRGLILNIVDIHGFKPLKAHPVYSIAKAGLAMLTQSLARELAPEVRVNGIAPGPILWPEAPLDEALKARILERTALKRTGSTEDIAKAALFFIKDAPYVTGQILAVDGGRSVGGL